MKIRTGLVLILLVLTLSLTTATVALTQHNSPTPAWTLTQTITLQQSTQKGITITWGPETPAPTNTTSYQHAPDVCCFPDGSRFVIVWTSIHTGDDDIYVKVFDSSGNNLTDDIRVNTDTTSDQGFPSVCCFPDGSRFVVAWQNEQLAQNNPDIYVKVFNSSTGENLTDDIRVNTNTTDNQMHPDVCCFPDGSRFVVSWHGPGQGDTQGVYVKLFNSSTGENLTDDILVNGITEDGQNFASVCCFPDNTGFVVVWNGRGVGDDWGIYAKVFNSTGFNQTDDILLNGYWYDLQQFPSVCCFPDSSGFVAAWQSAGIESDGRDIYVKVFNKTCFNQTDDIKVNTNTTGDQESPSVCCFSNGYFVVAWQSEPTVDDWDVYVKLFDSSGNNLTDDIRVNIYTTNEQLDPSVCCFPDSSRFVVTWFGEGQGETLTGVFFRMGHITPTIDASLLLLGVLFIAQSGAGVSVPLLVGGILVVAVVAGVLVFWWFRRGR